MPPPDSGSSRPMPMRNSENPKRVKPGSWRSPSRPPNDVRQSAAACPRLQELFEPPPIDSPKGVDPKTTQAQESSMAEYGRGYYRDYPRRERGYMADRDYPGDRG